MKTALTAALALALLASSTSGDAQNSSIVVSGERELSVWKTAFLQKLDQSIDRELRVGMVGQSTGGIAQVLFVRGSDGKAQGIEVMRNTSGSAMKSLASRVVSRLHDIPAIPASHRPDTTIQLNLIVAETDGHLDRLTRKLERWEKDRLAVRADQRRVLAVNYTNR